MDISDCDRIYAWEEKLSEPTDYEKFIQLEREIALKKETKPPFIILIAHYVRSPYGMKYVVNAYGSVNLRKSTDAKYYRFFNPEEDEWITDPDDILRCFPPSTTYSIQLERVPDADYSSSALFTQLYRPGVVCKTLCPADFQTKSARRS